MPETDLLDSPKQADSKLSSIGAPPKQPDTRGPLSRSTLPISSEPAVNLAAGLESPAEPVRTLASEETVRPGRNDFVVTGVGPIEVKGCGRLLVHVTEDESGFGKAGR